MPAGKRSPLGARPYRRAMAVEAQVSSMKTRPGVTVTVHLIRRIKCTVTVTPARPAGGDDRLHASHGLAGGLRAVRQRLLDHGHRLDGPAVSRAVVPAG